jgi:uncharacterized membrane protein (DUF373 family)
MIGGNSMTDRPKKRFLAASEQFLNIVNAILIATIAVVVLCAIGLLLTDVFSFVRDRTVEGIAAVLGSLLIIWVLMELLETQVAFFKGRKLDVSVFVLVAMVAFIRKLMVASLKADRIEIAVFPLVTIFGLSLVYLIIKISESRTAKQNQ